MTKLTAVFAILVLATACGDDDDGGGAEATSFTVPLTVAEEVPVCAGAGASAAGSATVTISADNSTITLNLTFQGLSAAATNAHIHFGAAGAAGGVIFPLGASPVSPVSATLTATDYPATPPEGAPANFAGLVTAMKAGTTYINVHTAACAPGEIRGQIN